MKWNHWLLITTWLLLATLPALAKDIQQPLSKLDKRAAADSFQAALEYNTSGIAVNWHNPDANISGQTIPVKTLQTPTGQQCREFERSVSIDNNKQRDSGTACRQADGRWRIVDPVTLRPLVKKKPVVAKRTMYQQPRYFYPYRYRYYPRSSRFYFGYRNRHYPGNWSYGWEFYDPWYWNFR